jgi:alpha-L-fucosidase 2
MARKNDLSRRQFLRDSSLTGAALAIAGSRRGWSEKSDREKTASHHLLFFDHPAEEWRDALPVGNGRLGAMVFGYTAKERLQLNEETIWTGEQRDRNNPQANRTPEVRKLLMAGKVHEAEALAEQTMMGIPDRLPCYQTLGDLWLDFDNVPSKAKDYRLELDLDEAVVKTSFTVDGMQWKREAFSSAPRNVVVARIEASQPFSVTVRLDRPANSETTASGNDGLVMTGAARPAKPAKDTATQERQVGVSFRAELKAIADSGAVKTSGNTLRVENARAVTLLLTAATDFREKDAAGMAAACARNLQSAQKLAYKDLRAEHVADYQHYAARTDLHLGDGPDPLADMPTDKRMMRVKSGGEDAGLVATYFQFGRYMLISSSRPGTLPANLQGIWNESIDPPWGSKFTVNINAEMNYWMAESANLAELHPQLFDLLDSTREAGKITAQKYYNARGFVVHHNTDIWGDTIPVDHVQAGIWALGAAWMATHLYTHYEYSLDTDFLRDRAYPRLKEVAGFLLDYLVEGPDGTLLSGPSQSPENRYRLPDGSTASLCMSPTMDTQIIRAVFGRVVRASKILGVDSDLSEQIVAAARRLPQYKINNHGTLQEWNEDYPETEPGHRHMSHLFALYPDNQITPHGTPDLAQASHNVIVQRLANGGGSTGWSRAWCISLLARLEDSEMAYQSVLALLRASTRTNFFDVCGLKPNAPFQIDGNLGGPAGLIEMLMQSHGGMVRLLPALPKAWPTGSFRGLRARGCVELDCSWRQGKAESATLRPAKDVRVRLAAPRGQKVASMQSAGNDVPLRKIDEETVEATLQSGAEYRVSFA